MRLWASGDRLPGGSPPILRSRCLPWPPPTRRRASGPAGSFPSGRLRLCWCGVSKSPVSTLRIPDTEAETTGGGGERGPGTEGGCFGQVSAEHCGRPRPREGLGHRARGLGRGMGCGAQGLRPGAHLASARAAPRAAAAGGAGTQVGGGGEQAAVEGDHLAGDKALQAAAQQQQAVARLHPVLVLSAVEARCQLRQHHVLHWPRRQRGGGRGGRQCAGAEAWEGAGAEAWEGAVGGDCAVGLAPPGGRPHVHGEGRGLSSSRSLLDPLGGAFRLKGPVPHSSVRG